MVRPFQDYRVWQLAHELTLEVYDATKQFPPDERYALTSQIRRAAYSVPMNIVEGSARSDTGFAYFLRIALGSAAELEYGLLLARDLGYLPDERQRYLTQKIGSVKRMLVTFINRVDSANTGPTANGQQPMAPGDAR